MKKFNFDQSLSAEMFTADEKMKADWESYVANIINTGGDNPMFTYDLETRTIWALQGNEDGTNEYFALNGFHSLDEWLGFRIVTIKNIAFNNALHLEEVVESELRNDPTRKK